MTKRELQVFADDAVRLLRSRATEVDALRSALTEWVDLVAPWLDAHGDTGCDCTMCRRAPLALARSRALLGER